MGFPTELRCNASDLNANTWTQILLGIGETKQYNSGASHGYGYYDKNQKQYVVTWDRSKDHDDNYKKLSFRTIIEKTGKYLGSIRNSNAAPQVRKTLELVHKGRVKQVKAQYCLPGRTIYRMISFFINIFKCLGCNTTEGLALRYARSLPKAVV